MTEEEIDAIIDKEKGEYHDPFIPFDLYKQKVKVESHAMMDELMQHIKNGYQQILQQLEKEFRSQEDSKEPKIKI